MHSSSMPINHCFFALYSNSNSIYQNQTETLGGFPSLLIFYNAAIYIQDFEIHLIKRRSHHRRLRIKKLISIYFIVE